jgi:hypothetical protein
MLPPQTPPFSQFRSVLFAAGSSRYSSEGCTHPHDCAICVGAERAGRASYRGGVGLHPRGRLRLVAFYCLEYAN